MNWEKKMRIRKRIVRTAISFLSMFLSPEDAKELFEELRDIAEKHKKH
jgi:DNA-directed RNA polymerase subunit F|tara:strand:- start:876 stop:1019 length:144 start_codon:yes stop_codon:yes gene_type:complete